MWVLPETVNVSEHPRLRISRPDLPTQMRGSFIRAATAGFAGFAVLGLVTAVIPSFLGSLLHQTSHALSGAVVFAVVAAAIVAGLGQGLSFRAGLQAGVSSSP